MIRTERTKKRLATKRRKLKPFPYQHRALRWLKDRKKAIVALEQGLGKTIVAALDSEPPLLIVCTATMKFRWAHELRLWRPDLRVQVIRSKDDKIDWSCNCWIVNYELTWKMALPDVATLVVDEAHKVKSPTSNRSKGIYTRAEMAQRVRYLTGTPMLSRPIELFGILTSIGAIDMSWKSYGRRFCAGWQTPWNVFDVSGASNLDELEEIVAEFMIRMTKKQVAPELPPKTYRVIPMDGPKPKKKEVEFLDFLKANLRLPENPVAFQAISDIRREQARRKLPDSVRYIQDLLEDGLDKVVVFAHHRESVEALYEALKSYNPVYIMGGVDPAVSYDRVESFQNDPSVRVFVGQMQAAGEGITLTASSHVVIVEPSWVPGEISQVADRCHRFGAVNPVTVDLLTVQGSLDCQMLWKCLDKLEIIEQVIKETEGMNTSKIAKLFRELADEFENIDAEDAKSVEEDQEERAEEEKPTRRRRRKAAEPEPEVEQEEEKPTRRRRRKAAEPEPEEDEDEPEEKPTRRRRKAEPEPEPEEDEDEPEEKPTRRRRKTAAKEETEAVMPDEADDYTAEDVRAAAAACMSAGKGTEVRKLIATHSDGKKKISDVPEDAYYDFVEDCRDLLEG